MAHKYLKARTVLLLLLTCLSVFELQIHALGATYSYKDLNLNYNVKRYLYSSGKNGYKFIMLTSKKGSTIHYRKARIEYDDIAGHDVFAAYGKTYIAKLTRKTKYYIPVEWSEMRRMQAYNYRYDTKTLKSLKLLQKVSKKTALNYMSLFYVKVKKGKVKTMISPAIFAI